MTAWLVVIVAFLAATGCSTQLVAHGGDATPKTGCESAAGLQGSGPATVTETPGDTDVPTEAMPSPTETWSPPVRTNVAVEPHPGFDRVIYAFADGKCSFWQAQYVSEAITYGHGQVLTVSGESVLEVVVDGCGVGPDRVRADASTVVTEIRRPPCTRTDPAAPTQLFIGVKQHKPAFEARVLSDPPRLVIDIAAAH